MPGQFIEIPVNHLELDSQNPRLPHSIDRNNQVAVLNWMIEDATLFDLMTSIIENGYFKGEAILVMPDIVNTGKFTVLEGNRRLAAIKLLQNPNLQTSSSFIIGQLSEEAKRKDVLPNSLWCYLIGSRNEIGNYLGFRHISGLKAWPVIGKARYLHFLFRQKTFGPNIYKELAREIGSKAPYVKRLLLAYEAFIKIGQNRIEYGLRDFSEDNFGLSIIADCFSYRAIADYINLNDDLPNPLNNINEQNFTHLVRWLYVIRDNGTTIIGESRNLQKLAKVLAFKHATEILLQTGNLEDAYQFTDAGNENLLNALRNSVEQTQEILKLLAEIRVVSSRDRELAQRLEDNAIKIYRDIRHLS